MGDLVWDVVQAAFKDRSAGIRDGDERTQLSDVIGEQGAVKTEGKRKDSDGAALHNPFGSIAYYIVV